MRHFLSDLKQRGRLDNAVVIVTGDHGEALGERGTLFHGWNLYDELVRVPLVLSGPAIAPGAIRSPVSLVRLPATLLELAGLEAPVSFAPALPLAGDEQRPARVFAHTRFRGADVTSVVEWPYKLILRQGRRRPELYDLSTDPSEQNNLCARKPLLVEELTMVIEEWLARQAEAGEELREDSVEEDAEIDPTLRRQLEALGYVDRQG